MLHDLNLLTLKPIIYIANVAEDEAANPDSNPHVKELKEFAAQEGAQVVAVSAKIEAEIAELPEDEAAVFLEELGLPESGLDKLIKASYSLLGLINFFTAGSDEVRAWTIVNGTKAQKAAGKSIPISNVASSALKSYRMMTSLPVAVNKLQKKKALSVWKARIISCKMVM